MSKLLDTDAGQQLTGGVHLRSLDCGDVIVHFGMLWRVVENAMVGSQAGVRLWQCHGTGRTSIIDDQNRIVDRVIGGRR